MESNNSLNEPVKDWNQWSADLKAKQDADYSVRLEKARTAALANGQELFDLDMMDELWDNCPDKLNASLGIPVSREHRIKDWEHVYYCSTGTTYRTMAEFVADMIKAQKNGAFDA